VGIVPGIERHSPSGTRSSGAPACHRTTGRTGGRGHSRRGNAGRPISHLNTSPHRCGVIGSSAESDPEALDLPAKSSARKDLWPACFRLRSRPAPAHRRQASTTAPEQNVAPHPSSGDCSIPGRSMSTEVIPGIPDREGSRRPPLGDAPSYRDGDAVLDGMNAREALPKACRCESRGWRCISA